jgi:hypothetical protein
MKFSPSVVRGSSRQGIVTNITEQEIEQIFGFASNVDDDPWKVVHSWAVDVDDTYTVHVWDYKGSHMFGQFSVCGDPVILEMIFGDRYVNESHCYN